MSTGRKILVACIAAVLLVAAPVVFFLVAFMGGMNAIQQAQQSCNSGFGQASNFTNDPSTTGELTNLYQAIKTDSQGDPYLAVAMLFGPYIEDHANNHASTADGGYGFYRIQQPVGNPTGVVVHPDITVQQALNPAYAVNYMVGRYRAALHRQQLDSPELWATNPMMAVEKVVYYAERPKYEYILNRPGDVPGAYQYAMAAMAQLGLPTPWTSSLVAGKSPLNAANVSKTHAGSIHVQLADQATVLCNGGNPAAQIRSTQAPAYCRNGSAVGGQKIVCSAWLFDNYAYNDPGCRGSATSLNGNGLCNGLRTLPDMISAVRACNANNFGSGCIYPKFHQIVDCSGMVAAAVYDALGVDLNGASTYGYPGNPHLKEIPFNQAQAGDLAWWNYPDGHTEVIESYDPATDTFHTFGAHQHYSDPSKVSQDIRSSVYHSTGNWAVQKVFRVVP